jgi:pimeloyl-ACP methyl ester carboxylesterase
VLSVAGRTGQPVLFVHGNVSSSLFWQPTMLALAEGYRPLAVDLRGFGDTDPEPVDAARGLGDYADDLAAVIEAGGRYREAVIQDSGHGPHLDQPERFLAALSEHLAQA